MFLRAAFFCLTWFAIMLAANADPFSIDAMIDDFVEDICEQHDTRALWWDMKAERDVLKDNRHYRNLRVTVSTGRIKYSGAFVNSIVPVNKHVQWFHNHQHNESQKTTIRKTTTHTQTYTWTVDRTYSLEQTLKFSLSPPLSFGFESTTKASLSMRSGSQDQQTDKIDISVEQQIVIPPRRSVKVTWIVNEVVQDIPWSADVTLRGWFAVWFYRRHSGHFLWFYPIDFLSGHGLKHVKGGGLSFIANGTFKGVRGADSSLRVEEYELDESKFLTGAAFVPQMEQPHSTELEEYLGKPIRVTYYPVPMPWNTPQRAVAGARGEQP